MKVNYKPAAAFLKRNVKVDSVQVRISAELKSEAVQAAGKMGTSLNRLIEAAILAYLDRLKKEGNI